MPKYFPLLAFLIFAFSCNYVNSQTNWTDNFNDSNFTTNPPWLGDTGNFTVNLQQQLQLNAPAMAASSSLYTQSTAAIHAIWEFWARMNFNPSTSNYAEVFLMTNANQPSTPQNGYILRLGGTTQDRISLHRRTGTATSLVAESNAGVLNSNIVDVRVRVQRDSNNVWTIEADTTGGNNFNLYATGTDATHQTSQYFMVNCIYTATRSTGFMFDDFSVNGQVFIDNIAPTLTSVKVENANQIRVHFSEEVNNFTATSTANYTIINPPQKPQNVQILAGNQEVMLTFATPFIQNQNFALEVKEVEDLAGNPINDTTLNLSFVVPEYRSILISEIMADPTPIVGLPDAEYVEIHNPGNLDINLENWIFAADKDTFRFPNYTLPAGDFLLILRHADTALFPSTQNKMSFSLPSGWLLNGGEPLAILDPLKTPIDGLSYDISWYRNEAKKEGGWSLEIINPNLPCSDPGNWSASKHPNGGTPGFANAPEQSSNFQKAELAGVVWFDESRFSLVFTQSVSPQLLPKIQSTIPITQMAIGATNPKEVVINLSQPIAASGIELIIENSQACSGNFISDTLVFSAPQLPDSGDVVLNEILFNPPTGGNTFVEIWNTSTKTIRAADLRLCRLDESNQPNQVYNLGADGLLILPKSFLVLTTNANTVYSSFSCGKRRFFSELSSMPSLPNTTGTAALTRQNLEVLDWVRYQEGWHHRSISNRQGVSLERVHPNLPSWRAESWHSAATAVNYATPAKINSQFASSSAQQESFWLNTQTFSPNNDGYNDVLLVEHRLDAGAMLTLRVFNTQGAPVATLANNHLTEIEGKYIWEGTTENGNIAPTGIYIIFAEWFYPNGNSGKAKLNVALAQ